MGLFYKPGDVLTGSNKLSVGDSESISREEYMILHASENKALEFYRNQYGDSSALDYLINDYLNYRKNWNQQPISCITSKRNFLKKPPLCVDIESASICDLACPFCYRSSLATPDRMIDFDFALNLIDQISQLKVPSMKFNWRGEPLLHPKLERMIIHAKKNGILETLINTNATQLTEKRSQSIIESGLDHMIYSFDGGSKETYEKNRPGRFRENKFENVLKNIRNFKLIRDSMNKKFPRTKIQMILTEDTYKEQESFFSLFKDYVDEVTVTQYSERGGNLNDLNESDKLKVIEKSKEIGLENSKNISYLKTGSGELYLSRKRKACQQPFQRLLITYDGRVSMCCYDWGAQHTIGCLKEIPKDPNYDKYIPLKGSKEQTKSFKYLKDIKKPPQYVDFPDKVSSIEETWNSKVMLDARKKHIEGNIDKIEICKNCSFKDTYEWE